MTSPPFVDGDDGVDNAGEERGELDRLEIGEDEDWMDEGEELGSFTGSDEIGDVDTEWEMVLLSKC